MNFSENPKHSPLAFTSSGKLSTSSSSTSDALMCLISGIVTPFREKVSAAGGFERSTRHSRLKLCRKRALPCIVLCAAILTPDGGTTKKREYNLNWFTSLIKKEKFC